MTGRDLIVYILQNNLEDELVFQNGKFLGFMTEDEAAVKFNVGLATVRVWVAAGALHGVRLGNIVYIPANAKDPRKGVDDVL